MEPTNKPTEIIYYDSIPLCSLDDYLDYLSEDDGDTYSRFFDFALDDGTPVQITIGLDDYEWEELAKIFIENNDEKTFNNWRSESITVKPDVVEFYTEEYSDVNYKFIVEKRNCRFLENVFSNDINIF